jgi:hypothetical protein
MNNITLPLIRAAALAVALAILGGPAPTAMRSWAAMLSAISCGWLVPEIEPDEAGTWNPDAERLLGRMNAVGVGDQLPSKDLRLGVAPDHADEREIPLRERPPQDGPVGGVAHRHDGRKTCRPAWGRGSRGIGMDHAEVGGVRQAVEPLGRESTQVILAGSGVRTGMSAWATCPAPKTAMFQGPNPKCGSK